MMDRQLSLFSEEKVPQQVYEFLFVINPSGEIQKYVKNLKDELSERFGYYPSRGSKPHLTIAHFPLPEKEPKAVMSYLQRGLNKIEPFYVKVDGFKSFSKNSRVIYLDISEFPELEALLVPFRHLRKSFKPKKYFTIVKNPHITIAKGLHPDILKKAEDMYLSRIYMSSFLADRLTVLRREVSENGKRGRYEYICCLTLGKEL